MGRKRSASARKAAKGHRNRRLFLEILEDRRLLTIADLGAIEGTLFYNLPGGIEKPVPGQTVTLYRDDGDGVFDENVDVLVEQQVTDIDGAYRFVGLTAGTYFLVQPPEPSGNIHPAPVPVVATVVIGPEDADGAEGVILDEFITT